MGRDDEATRAVVGFCAAILDRLNAPHIEIGTKSHRLARTKANKTSGTT
ncbi:hypothetical protein [Streptomyces sp. N50]|nr:hypothetical protein [Streptomyces sp. N50]WOX11452.1 hypothetical protein R2B38_22635 [Streptomyces sp. N50]